MSASAASPSIAERFRAIVRRAIRSVTRRFRQEPEMGLPAARGAEMTRPAMPAAARDSVAAFGLKERCDRLLALMARIQSGGLLPQRPRAAHGDDATGERPVGAVPARRRDAPRASGWLNEVAADCRPYGGILLELIEAPGIRAMCLATPQMGRQLAPVLHALGEALPDWMPKRTRAKRRRPAPSVPADLSREADQDRDAGNPAKKLAVSPLRPGLGPFRGSSPVQQDGTSDRGPWMRERHSVGGHWLAGCAGGTGGLRSILNSRQMALMERLAHFVTIS